MIKQFLREEEGQTTVEYLLIIGVIVVVITVMGNQMKERLPGTIEAVFKGVNAKIGAMMNQ